MPLVFILVLVSTLWILQFGLMIALQGSCMLFYFNFSYRYLIYCFMNPVIFPDTFLSSALPDQMVVLYIMVCLLTP